MIKSVLTAAVVAMTSTPAFAVPYNDTVTFSASEACSELTGVKYPSEVSDIQWNNYLKCIQVLHYFDTKY